MSLISRGNLPILVEQLYTSSKGAKPKVARKMKKEFARRLPGVGKWVRALDELQVKYARLQEQRDELKIDLAEAPAQLEPFLREGNEREAELHKLECSLPIPPEHLRRRVHGRGDEAERARSLSRA